jgi:diaminopimelate decarboxylase
VSGGEIKAALKAGFPAESIVFAGVGKSDWENAVQKIWPLLGFALKQKLAAQ